MIENREHPKIIAFYLPQFHPIPENDEWYGKGFTEWTNVGKAKPLFPCHYQPKIPADLGYYDLRVPETRENQVQLAKEAGIYGFCYWHYWFEPGKELLQLPFNQVVDSGKPDFPFCLAWANENWHAKQWNSKKTDKLLIEQKYLGTQDYTKHFYSLLKAFKDKRYIKIDGKPLFLIYKPLSNKNEIEKFMKCWQQLARENGLHGIYFVAQKMDRKQNIKEIESMGFSKINICTVNDVFSQRPLWKRGISKVFHSLFKFPNIMSWDEAAKYLFNKNIDTQDNIIPSIIAGWDHTPRSGKNGSLFFGETPEKFFEYTKYILQNTKSEFVFLKSWNEWAEGNYIEPDLKYGKGYIYALKKALDFTPPPPTYVRNDLM